MPLEMTDLKDVVERLNILETRNRRLQRGFIAALIALSTVILMGQATPSPPIIEAQKFVLKDANGKVRGWMGIIGSGSELALGNVNAQPMISFEVSNDSGDLHFYGSRRSGMNLGVNSGKPSISIADADGQGAAGITFAKTGPSLNLQDASGFSTVIGSSQIDDPTRPTQPSSAASIVLLGRDKKVIWRAP
jgi:hypothetical protein